MLEEIAMRLVSTARLVPNFTHSETSLPSANEQQSEASLSMESQTGSTPGTVTGQNQPLANRDSHHAHQTLRACDRYDTSDDHCLGDPEMPEGPTHRSSHVTQNLQSPDTMALRSAVTEPPSAVLAQQSSPPDEDFKPKHVADSERIHITSSPQQLTNNPIDHSPIPPEATVNLDTNHSTVAPNSSSPLSHNGLSTEPEGTPLGDPRLALSGEPAGMPVHPKANRQHRALAKQRILLDKMCNKLISQTDKINQLAQHQCTAKCNIMESNKWQSVQSMFANCSPQAFQEAKNLATKPLLDCIDRHYLRIQQMYYQQITTNQYNSRHPATTDTIYKTHGVNCTPIT